VPDERFDIVVIGGGIVGLSVAMQAARRLPQLRIAVIEKEPDIARHQSGHNSGVIHSGIYYKPGSLKARMCVDGAAEMIEFCRHHGIPHRVCGKVIIATNDKEVTRLEQLFCRGQSNGISGITLLNRDALRAIEPHAGGVRALRVPGTGITDYVAVCRKYAELFLANGGQVLTATEVTNIVRRGKETVVETRVGIFKTSYVINCAGLHSDRISRMCGQHPDVAIIPFRGEYYELAPQAQKLVQTLIYPVPDPSLPFLGVHFTIQKQSGVEAGPNAVLAFKREGYRRGSLKISHTAEMFTYSGFWRMALKNWQTGFGEFYRSFNKAGFVRALRQLVPELKPGDLRPAGSGVRAQAVRRDGNLVDDFYFKGDENMLHVLNVPSPAATASLPIGRAIAIMAEQNFGLKPGGDKAARST